MTQCFECDRQLKPDGSSGDLCPDCASKIRSELTLSFQLRRAWDRWHTWSPRFPVVTPMMIAIIATIYWFATQDSVSRDTFEAMLSMQTTQVLHGQVWRLVTASFLHLRPQHLIGSLIPLCVLGSLAEKLFGPSRFLLLWLATGTAGSIAELLGYRRAVFSYGSSTVEYGLLGVLLTVYLFKQKPASKVHIALIGLLAAYTGAGFFVDWFFFHRIIPGHVGGLATGLMLAWIVPLKSVSKLPPSSVLRPAG